MKLTEKNKAFRQMQAAMKHRSRLGRRWPGLRCRVQLADRTIVVEAAQDTLDAAGLMCLPKTSKRRVKALRRALSLSKAM